MPFCCHDASDIIANGWHDAALIEAPAGEYSPALRVSCTENIGILSEAHVMCPSPLMDRNNTMMLFILIQSFKKNPEKTIAIFIFIFKKRSSEVYTISIRCSVADCLFRIVYTDRSIIPS